MKQYTVWIHLQLWFVVSPGQFWHPIPSGNELVVLGWDELHDKGSAKESVVLLRWVQLLHDNGSEVVVLWWDKGQNKGVRWWYCGEMSHTTKGVPTRMWYQGAASSRGGAAAALWWDMSLPPSDDEPLPPVPKHPHEPHPIPNLWWNFSTPHWPEWPPTPPHKGHNKGSEVVILG